MATTAEFGSNEMFTHVIGEIAKAVCERSGETAQQQIARSQAAVHMILGFHPRDVIETMLAGHSVMLHETMLASVHDTLLGEPDTMRTATRGTVVAMNKEFNSNLTHLERYQARPVLGLHNASERRPAAAMPTAAKAAVPPAAPTARTEVAPDAPVPANGAQNPTIQPPQTDPLRSAAQPEPDRRVEHDPDAKTEYRPSPESLAECQANPEAMAAIAAGDPERWAKALGIAAPSEAFLEAANAPGSPFDPNANGPWPATPRPGAPKG